MSLDRLVAAMSIALIVVATGSRAQERQAPTFRTQLEAVSVDVSVLDEHRHPVIGLRADDFTILEDGHARPVIAFAVVDALASNARLKQFPPSLGIAQIDPEAASPGRVVGIIMPFVRNRRDFTVMAQQIATTLVKQLEPGDLAMIIFPGRSGTWTATSDKKLLLKQIDETAISLAMGQPGDHGGDACLTAELEAMFAYAESVREISTRRKLMFAIAAVPRFTVMNECAGKLAAARERLFHAVRVSNVTVYALDPMGLGGGDLFQQGNLRLLPDLTGGRTIMNTNTPQEFVPDIFAETASYYVLGFQPETPVQLGAHTIKVNVSRRNVHVVARTEWDARQ